LPVSGVLVSRDSGRVPGGRLSRGAGNDQSSFFFAVANDSDPGFAREGFPRKGDVCDLRVG